MPRGSRRDNGCSRNAGSRLSGFEHRVSHRTSGKLIARAPHEQAHRRDQRWQANQPALQGSAGSEGRAKISARDKGLVFAIGAIYLALGAEASLQVRLKAALPRKKPVRTGGCAEAVFVSAGSRIFA